MSRRRFTVDWSYLRWLIESNLCNQAGFPNGSQVEGKIDYYGDGLFHDNYGFGVADHPYVLRLAKRRHSPRSETEAKASLQRETETLRQLAKTDFPFPTPRFVCEALDESGEMVGFIETWLRGIPVFSRGGISPVDPLEAVAEVASAVHHLSQSQFSHLRQSKDSSDHVLESLAELPAAIVDSYPAASDARAWILKNLPHGRPSVLLHGDLLPQNIFFSWSDDEEERFSVIDWETARIGDPAYDLAIVTRGVRKPFKQQDGLKRIVAAYNEFRGTNLTVSAVQVHELLMNLSWLCESAEQRRAGHWEGDGPEQYENAIASILRRTE